MFDTTDQILNQLRAGEDGLAEFKTLRLGDRGALSPNTEDLAGELVARERRRRHHLSRRRRSRRRGPASRRSASTRSSAGSSTSPRTTASHRFDRFCARSSSRRPPARNDTCFWRTVPPNLYVRRTSGGRYYLRVGSTKRALAPPQLARLFQRRGREYVFDEQPVLAASVDHPNRHRLEAFFGRFADHPLARACSATPA